METLDGIDHTVAIAPADAVLAQPLTATLRYIVNAPCEQCFTFSHSSLVVTLSRLNSTREPFIYLPNVKAVHERGMLIRINAPGGQEDLKTGETQEVKYDLLRVFPALLSVGEFSLSYSLGNESSPQHRAEFRIRSGPECMLYLTALVDGSDAGLKLRAAALFRKMTGQYDVTAGKAELWWRAQSSYLTWQPDADRATATGLLPPGGATALEGPRLGGFVLPDMQITVAQKQQILTVIRNWSRTGDIRELAGRMRVADLRIDYPASPTLFHSDQDITKVVISGLELAISIDDREKTAPAAELFVRTAAYFPDSRFIPILYAVFHEFEAHGAGSLAGNLLDWMDVERVPVVL